MTLDLAAGTVEMSVGSGDLPQLLSLAFSVAVLYVMCRPRAVDSEGRSKNTKYSPTRGRIKTIKVATDSYPFLLATGWHECVPCNSFYLQHHHFAVGDSASACVSGGCGGCG